jgi:predicted MFS family arabinose efflux permease
VNAAPPREHPHPIAAIKEGLLYTFSRPDLRLIMAVVPLISIFGWAYAAILPVIASEMFGQDAAGLGYLHTAVGFGALAAILLVSVFIHRLGPRPFIIGGNLLLAVSLLVFSFISVFALGLGMVFVIGLALITQLSVMQTTVQHAIQDSIRGRVMGIYVMMFRGTMPFGAFLIGYLADLLNPQWAVRLMALPLIATTAVLVLNRRIIPRRLEIE